MIDKAQAAGAADEEIRVWRLVRHPACVCLLGVYDLSQARPCNSAPLHLCTLCTLCTLSVPAARLHQCTLGFP